MNRNIIFTQFSGFQVSFSGCTHGANITITHKNAFMWVWSTSWAAQLMWQVHTTLFHQICGPLAFTFWPIGNIHQHLASTAIFHGKNTLHAGYTQHIILDMPRNSTSLHQASHNLVLIGDISQFLPTSTAIFVTHFHYLLLYYHSMSKIISNYISILPWYFPNDLPIYFLNDFQLYFYSSIVFPKLFPIWFPIIFLFFRYISQIISHLIYFPHDFRFYLRSSMLFPKLFPNLFSKWFPIISPFFHDISQIISQFIS